MWDRSENINVFLTSKPIAIMSLAFSLANFLAFSMVRSFQRNFSSSVSWMTKGTLNASWSQRVNMNGIRCPKCRADDDGPLPVYRKNGFFSSWRLRMVWRSRWEKNMPLLKKWCTFWSRRASILSNNGTSILLHPNRTVNHNHLVIIGLIRRHFTN